MTCIQSWLNLAAIYDAQLYIICEKTEIINEISKNCLFGSITIEDYAKEREREMDPLFVGAYFNTLTKFAERLVKPWWVKAAVSHLTTFYHAQENDYKTFWNIDADDTMFFTPSATELKAAFQKVEALASDYDCISLDMWNSLNNGRHWSFGVAYIYVDRPWESIIEKNIELAHAIWKKNYLPERVHNLDFFFTSLMEEDILKAHTFYIERASFCHYGMHYLLGKEVYPGFGLNYWFNERIIFPLLSIDMPISRYATKIELDNDSFPLPNAVSNTNLHINEKQDLLKKIYIRELNNSLKSAEDSYIYTFHDTFISFNLIKNHFYHGNKLTDHIRYKVIGPKICLIYNNKYIFFNTKLERFELSDNLFWFDIIYNDDATISIKVKDRFLSAWNNGDMITMHHCLTWERFYC